MTNSRATRLLLAFVPASILVTAAVKSLSTSPAPSSTVPVAFGAVQPRISPDGRSVAFSYHGNIWQIPSAGGAMRRLAHGPGYAVEPCWSPDGKRIAFLEGPSWGSGRLRIVDATTGAAEEPATAKNFQGSGKLFFDATGSRLLGSLRSGRQTPGLRWINLRTGEATTVVRGWSFRQCFALSHDGQWIAYATTMDVAGEQGGNDGQETDVWKLPAVGGDPVRIVRFPARIHDLCWSADAESLIVSTELGGIHNDLFRIALDDPARPTKLTYGQADEDRPSVSHDGRWLLYRDNRHGCPHLVRRELSSGQESIVAADRLDFGNPTGWLKLSVRERGNDRPIVARVAARDSAGSWHAPPGSLWRVHRNLAHFYVNGDVEFEVPAGTLQITVFHGPEFRAARRQIEIPAGASIEQAFELERWTDPNAQGWYCGENHIHANYGYGEYYNSPRTMLEMCAGEGLNVANLMVANSNSNGTFDREFFRGRPDALSTPGTILYWNQEFRSTIWGHMTLVNLKQLVEPIYTGFLNTTNPWDIPTNADIADRTHMQDGLVNYTHPSARTDDLYSGAYTAKGLPVDAALGKIDSMDVMGSNDVASTALYHRLLNCGFRLAASAGTDCFLNRVRSYLPGAERAYVKIEGPMSYAAWIDGLRASRSFVTNGPMLELRVDGRGIGEELRLPGAASIRITAKASSQFPLSRLDVLYNGKVVAEAAPEGGGTAAEIDRTVRVDRSGWIAARVIGPSHEDIESNRPYAHTSPVYVRLEGTSAGSPEDAKFFIDWINVLEAAVFARDRIPTEGERTRVRSQFERARAVYLKIAAGR